MDINTPQQLKTDKDFKNLIRPLRRQDHLKLEKSIRTEGCKNPIIVWNGIIVDGHKRYEICLKYGISFEIEEMDFICKQEAIAWICALQLKRKDITEEQRKFLIGMQYETEKYVNHLLYPKGNNQYMVRIRAENAPEAKEGDRYQYGYKSRHRTATKIATENNISFGTVEKYAYYTRALEAIGAKVPELVPMILSSALKISHAATLELADRDIEELQKFYARVSRTKAPYYHYGKRKATAEIMNPSEIPQTSSIKDMPVFDPDGSITELSLTIPTWVNSINRIRNNTDFSITTEPARKKLTEALTELGEAAIDLLTIIAKEN